jgi:hypothetical protein
MKAKILMAGVALFAFTTIGFAQGTTKKTEGTKEAKTECTKAKDGEKSCCEAAKTDKSTTDKVAITKKPVAKPTAKK